MLVVRGVFFHVLRIFTWFILIFSPQFSSAKIKEIGESCGARVTAVEEVLPGSNERQVIIHGKHEAIVSAVEKIYRLVVSG